MIDNSIERSEEKLQPQRFCQQKNSSQRPPYSIINRRDLVLNIPFDISSNTFCMVDLYFYFDERHIT